MPQNIATQDIATPFVSSVMRIEPQWIDFNGHLNMAYYNVLFDRAVDELYDLFGLGESYLQRTRHSTMLAEMHVRYLREIHLDTPVRVRVQVLDCDEKRLHCFEELVHAEQGWVSATSENLTLHVDMTAKKVAPWPADVLARLVRVKEAHAVLPWPDGVGRSVGIRRKS